MTVELEDQGQDLLWLTIDSKGIVTGGGPFQGELFKCWRVMQLSLRKGMKLRLKRPLAKRYEPMIVRLRYRIVGFLE